MIRPRFLKLVGMAALAQSALTGPACTHYYLDRLQDDGVSNDTDNTGNMESLEEIVPYGVRAPIEKVACEGDPGYKLRYAPGYTPDSVIKAKVDSLVNNMTLQEKIVEISGTDPQGGVNESDIFRQPSNREKGIRGFEFRDGPRGLNLDAELLQGHNGFATAFPVSMARGAAFDIDLEYRIGMAQGDETLASRNTLLLAPTVNLLRHPAWGRAQETYGEDPFLLGRLGSAYTVGVQQFIPACAKHYIANNVENQRSSINSVMDEQTLREIYGRAYEMIVRDAGVASIMAAYNPVNGVKSTENHHTLQEILRDDFGFKGFVLSDWWAMTNGKDAGRLPGDYQKVAIEGISAGMDMELPWSLNYGFEHIQGLINDGQITEGQVTDSVRRVLQQKFRFNVGDKSTSVIGLKKPTVGWDDNTSSITDYQAHINLAEEAALKGAVLLKNDQQTLPINRTTVSTIAVLGAPVDFELTPLQIFETINFATDVITGDLGSSRVRSDPDESVGPVDGIAEAAGSEITVIPGTTADDAATADFVVVVAGLTPEDEGEEYTGAGDRSTFALDGKISGTPQNNLIEAVAALGKPMVVVLIGGSVIDMPWLASVPAVLMAWYPGMVGGRALGKLLFGEVSPGGKLPFTWPVSWDDEPVFNPGTAVDMGYFVGYRYFEQTGKAPLFPFGHGLSYSQFEYLNLEVPCSTVPGDGVVKVKVDVSNRGSVAADEIAFLFTAHPGASDERRQIKQLKGFYRVHLEPDQTKQITFPLRIDDLRFYDMAAEKWQIEPGPVTIMVGSSADNILLTDQMTINVGSPV